MKRYDILIPAAEVARLIGVSRQRVHQLAATESFPRPLTNTTDIYQKRLWSTREIQKWLKARKPRRKRKQK